MAQTTFAEMRADEPDMDWLRSQYGLLEQSFSTATDSAGRAAVIDDWNELRRGVETWVSLSHVHFAQDTRDSEYKKEKDRVDELGPLLNELEVAFKRHLLASPHRAEIEASFGRHAFDLWQADLESFAPVIIEDSVAEAKLSSEYTELKASAKISFRGEELNLPGLGRYTSDGDRDTRHAASQAQWDWFAANGEALDRIYDEMVKLRATMAKKLGYEDFVELGYKRMQRVDYDRADVKRFRDQVRHEVVPLVARIKERQAQTLGLDKLMSWDEGTYLPGGNPRPRGEEAWMTDQAKTMFSRMNPDIASFFNMMVNRGLLDLTAREGKAGGGFCTSLPTYDVPFIFANFNGTDHDVNVFTHEAGHAFQSWCSRDAELVDYVWPTYEAAEVHSMSLEFLTWPHMELFFEEEAEAFRRVHLASSLSFLPYGVAVDHFQHLVYEQPDLSPADRHDLWREMERIYLPWRDYGDLERPAMGGLWQRQSHIYGMPFYYIDYTLALTCALQFWVMSRRDMPDAFQHYLALCKRGGRAPFQDLVRSAGLRSPFEAGCLTDVVGEAERLIFA